MFTTRKVVIIGAGHVGSHVALALMQSGEADEIALIDIDKEKAAAQALDIDDGVSKSTMELPKDQYENVSALDLLGGIRFIL